MTHLFFVTSTSEAEESIYRINRLPKTDSFSIISNNPLANLFLAAYKFVFSDSGDFFPVGEKLRSHQLKITSISKQWAKLSGVNQILKYRGYKLDDIVSFSLFIYLAEVEHSLLVAQNILKNISPDMIHVSRRFTESPFRRYQTEKLNLENLALGSLARHRHIEVNPLLPSPNTAIHIKNALEIAAKFIKPLLQLKTSFRASNGSITILPLVILANYYQLINLFPFISKLKTDNVGFTAIGKTDLAQLKLVNESDVPFSPIGSTQNASSAIQTIRYVYLWHKFQHQIMNSFNTRHPLYWNLIKEKLRYLFTIEFPQITDYLNQAEKNFSCKPKILLTTATNDTISKCYALSAARQGIKVVELQHGLVIYDEEWPFRTNQIHAVWGKPLTQIMNQGDRQHKSFAVTGFPYFDKYRNKINLEHFSRHGKEKTVLILAAFPVAADRLIAKTSPYLFLDMVLKTIGLRHKNWKIIFRPHPSYNAAWVKEIARNLSVNLIFDQRGTPLNQAVSSCDVVISNFTTAMIDAMFIGKPILLYSFADQDSIKLNQHPLITSDAAAIFNNSDELKNLLAKISLDKDFVRKMKAGQKEFLKSYCSISDESAGDRLLGLINSKLHK